MTSPVTRFWPCSLLAAAGVAWLAGLDDLAAGFSVVFLVATILWVERR